MLMNVCQVHGVSNKFVDELLALLHLHLLPRDNCLPSSMYRAKVLTSKVGLVTTTFMLVAMVVYYFESNTKGCRSAPNVGLFDIG
jgi:hypothetical protein